MSEQDDKNKRKTKLLIITLIAIIVVLFAGIIYQFVTIKKLQKIQEGQTPTSCVKIIDDNYNNLIEK